MPLKPPTRSTAAPARVAGGAGAGPWPTVPQGLLGLLLGLLLLLGNGAPALAAIEEAVLAGGCFWCLEHDLEELPGVLEVESGYSGGKVANPTYQQVSAGGTGHQESVRVRYDTTRLRYEVLLRAYWRNIDPFDGGGQFCDRGDSYRPVIFTTNATQAVEARNSLVAASRELGRPTSKIKVAVRALNRFWPAEGYHQNYARRNGLRYRYYRWACRRDQRLDQVWGARARRSDRWANANQGGGQAALPLAAPAAPADPASPGAPAAPGRPAPPQAAADPAQVAAAAATLPPVASAPLGAPEPPAAQGPGGGPT